MYLVMEIDEDIIVIACLLEEEENEEEQQRIETKPRMWVHDINLKRPIFGEYHSLFVPDLLRDEQKFMNYIHMSRVQLMYLYSLLKPHLTKQNTNFRKAVGPEERLVVTLRYFATGNSFRSLAFNFRMGERTVREIVQSTSKVIWNVLRPTVMPEPDEELWIASEKGFRERWNLAALDGKHIAIESPPRSGSKYYCYKKHFSLVLLALVDADKKFIAMDIGAYGKNSDAAIFRNSNMGKKFSQGTFKIPAPKIPTGGNQPLPHVIIGDEAFPLCTNSMRPYSRVDVRQNEEKKTFNYRPSRARNTVENAFGILVRKFGIFQRPIKMSQQHTVSVALAICCLHNFIRNNLITVVDEDWSCEERVQNMSNHGLQDLTHFGGNVNCEATVVRDRFKEYFCSEAGAVSWQQSKVRAGRQLQ